MEVSSLSWSSKISPGLGQRHSVLMWDHCRKLMHGIIVILQMRLLADAAIQHPPCPHFNHSYACCATDLASQTRLIHETKPSSDWFTGCWFSCEGRKWVRQVSALADALLIFCSWACVEQPFRAPGLWTALPEVLPLLPQTSAAAPSHRQAHIHWSQTGAADSSAVVVAPRCFLYHVCQWAIWLAMSPPPLFLNLQPLDVKKRGLFVSLVLHRRPSAAPTTFAHYWVPAAELNIN